MHSRSKLKDLLNIDNQGSQKMEPTVKADVNDAIRITNGVELKSRNGETWKSGGKMILNPGSV